jgi:polysaccharide transporter, PST family
MQFVKSSLWAGLVIVFKALGNILINKVISSYYQNPQIFALLAHFQNLLGIYSSIPSDGINQGAIKYLSDKSLKEKQAQKIFYTGLWLNFFVFLISALSLLFFRNYFIKVFAQGIQSALWIGIILGVLFVQLINLYFLAFLLSRQHLKLYAFINIASILSGVLLTVYCLINSNFTIVLFSVGFGPSSLFFITIFIINKYYYPLFRFKGPDLDSIKKLGEFILMAASIMFFGRVVDFIVREYAMSEFTVYQTGLWQASVKFSDYYMAAFVSLIGMVYYPKVSQLVNDNRELRNYVKHVLKISIPIILMGLVLIYIFRNYILLIFFDEKFMEAEKYFMFQLMGDFLKMVSYILGFIIVAQARTVLFISTQAISSLLYVGLIFLLTQEYGMEGFPIAHLIRYVFFTGFMILIYRKLLFA